MWFFAARAVLPTGFSRQMTSKMHRSRSDQALNIAGRWTAPPPKFSDRHQTRCLASIDVADLNCNQCYILIEGPSHTTLRSLSEDLGSQLLSQKLLKMRDFAGGEIAWRRRQRRRSCSRKAAQHAPGHQQVARIACKQRGLPEVRVSSCSAFAQPRVRRGAPLQPIALPLQPAGAPEMQHATTRAGLAACEMLLDAAKAVEASSRLGAAPPLQRC